MPLDEATLSARDAQRNIGLELLEAVRQVKAGNVGNQQQIATDTVLRTLCKTRAESGRGGSGWTARRKPQR